MKTFARVVSVLVLVATSACAAAPAKSLLRVVGGPDVERREFADRTLVGDRVLAGDLCPGADSHAVRLLNATRLCQRADRRIAVGPDAFLERATQLWNMGATHYVVVGMFEGGEEEEAVVLESSVSAAIVGAEDQQLFTFRQCSDGDGPLFDCDWHLRYLTKTSVFAAQLPQNSGIR